MKGFIVAAAGAPFFWWGAPEHPILSMLAYNPTSSLTAHTDICSVAS